MSSQSRSDLISDITSNIADGAENTAADVRGELEDIVDSTPNVIDGFVSGDKNGEFAVGIDINGDVSPAKESNFADRESAIQSAIDQVNNGSGRGTVLIPAGFKGYDPSAVTFVPDIKMQVATEQTKGYNVEAYGAYGNYGFVSGARNRIGIQNAINQAVRSRVCHVYIPSGRFEIDSTIYADSDGTGFPSDGQYQGAIRIEGQSNQLRQGDPSNLGQNRKGTILEFQNTSGPCIQIVDTTSGNFVRSTKVENLGIVGRTSDYMFLGRHMNTGSTLQDVELYNFGQSGTGGGFKFIDSWMLTLYQCTARSDGVLDGKGLWFEGIDNPQGITEVHAMDVDGYTTSVLIEDETANSTGQSNINFYGGHFDEADIGFDINFSSKISLNGCWIENASQHFIKTTNYTRMSIDNVAFNNNNGCDYLVQLGEQGASGLEKAAHTVISNCQMRVPENGAAIRNARSGRDGKLVVYGCEFSAETSGSGVGIDAGGFIDVLTAFGNYITPFGTEPEKISRGDGASGLIEEKGKGAKMNKGFGSSKQKDLSSITGEWDGQILYNNGGSGVVGYYWWDEGSGVWRDFADRSNTITP